MADEQADRSEAKPNAVAVEQTTEPFQRPDRVDHFELGELLGRGGMGRVYRARDLRLDRIVALKMLAIRGDAEMRARFLAEAKVVARMRHPNIAPIYEAGEAEWPYYTMELLEGGSLAEAIARQPLPPKEAARLLVPIARAIDACHQQGILHRDLKPSNILLAADRTPKVADFGIAKWIENDGNNLTPTGEVLGTAAYMSPEQASGVVKSPGPGSDIYSLGAILYEMLTGRPPFQASSPVQTILMVVSMEPVPPRQLVPRIPRDIETICLKCLEKSARRRYQSAGELAGDLERFLNGQYIFARPASALDRAIKWSKRRPALAALIAVAIAATAALGVGYLRLSQSMRETEESLSIANTAIDRMLVRLSDELAPVPQSEKVRRASLEDARKLYERVAFLETRDELGEYRRGLALSRLAEIERLLGDSTRARKLNEKARGLFSGILQNSPEDAEARLAMAAVRINFANIVAGNDYDGGLFEEAIQDIAGKLPPKFEREEKTMVGKALNNLALLKQRIGKPAEAEDAHRRALEVRKKLLAKRPQDRDLIVDTATSHSNLGSLLMATGRTSDAAGEFASAIALTKPWYAEALPAQRFLLGQVEGNAAAAEAKLNHVDTANRLYESAIERLKSLERDYSSAPAYAHRRAVSEMNYGLHLASAGKIADATARWESALAGLGLLREKFPENAEYNLDWQRCGEFLKMAATPTAPAIAPQPTTPKRP